jgi:hypothetical protein
MIKLIKINSVNIRRIIINISVFFFVILPILGPSFVNAGGETRSYVFENPFNTDGDLFTFVLAFVNFVLNVLAAVVVIFIIYAGFLFVVAQGEDAKITKAKKNFFWAVIGGTVILTAKVLAYTLCLTANELGSSSECNVFGS